MSDMDDDTSRATTVAGGAVLGALVTGVFALISAVDSSGEARAIALVAAAVAFAGVANAIFRR